MPNPKRKWDFTIERRNGLERTVVGRDGQIHHPTPNGPGKHGAFTANQEGEYRRSIDNAVNSNSTNRHTSQPNNRATQQGVPVIQIGPLQYDSYGILPADGYGRLSSEDY